MERGIVAVLERTSQAGKFPFNSVGDRELEEVGHQEDQPAKWVGMECVGERQKEA